MWLASCNHEDYLTGCALYPEGAGAHYAPLRGHPLTTTSARAYELHGVLADDRPSMEVENPVAVAAEKHHQFDRRRTESMHRIGRNHSIVVLDAGDEQQASSDELRSDAEQDLTESQFANSLHIVTAQFVLSSQTKSLEKIQWILASTVLWFAQMVTVSGVLLAAANPNCVSNAQCADSQYC